MDEPKTDVVVLKCGREPLRIGAIREPLGLCYPGQCLRCGSSDHDRGVCPIQPKDVGKEEKDGQC
jgi:hypothetical protein